MYTICSERIGVIGEPFTSDDPIELAWLLDGGFIKANTPKQTAKKAADIPEEE